MLRKRAHDLNRAGLALLQLQAQPIGAGGSVRAAHAEHVKRRKRFARGGDRQGRGRHLGKLHRVGLEPVRHRRVRRRGRERQLDRSGVPLVREKRERIHVGPAGHHGLIPEPLAGRDDEVSDTGAAGQPIRVESLGQLARHELAIGHAVLLIVVEAVVDDQALAVVNVPTNSRSSSARWCQRDDRTTEARTE